MIGVNFVKGDILDVELEQNAIKSIINAPSTTKTCIANSHHGEKALHVVYMMPKALTVKFEAGGTFQHSESCRSDNSAMRAPFPTKKQTSSRTCQLSIVIVHEARSELDIGLQLEQISEVPKSAICIFFKITQQQWHPF